MSDESKNIGVEAQLYYIGHILNRIANAVERIEASLKRVSLQPAAESGEDGRARSLDQNERERIALQLWTTLDVEAEASFRHADGWIAERDRQRIRQAE